MKPIDFIASVLGGDENLAAILLPNGIQAREKLGQLMQAEKQTLPRVLNDPIHLFEELGFVFGKPVDEHFQEATFPAGWKKQPTDHDMWTDILDDQGRVRGSIFYKAAFYDRSAHARLCRRFHVTRKSLGVGKASVGIVDACGIVDRAVTGLDWANWSEGRETALAAADALDQAHTEMAEWLDTHYPDWTSPTAYWDVPSTPPNPEP